MDGCRLQSSLVVLLMAGVTFAAGAGGEPFARQNKTPEGKVETTLKYDTWVWDAEAWLLTAEPSDPNADESIRQAVRAALRVNSGRPVLWVHLKLKLERLAKLIGGFDPNNPHLSAEAFAGLVAGKMPGITPAAPAGRIRSDGPNRYLDQNLIFRLPERASSIEVDVGTSRQLPVAMFSMSRLLLGTDSVFPWVRPSGATSALDVLTGYARKLNLKPLERNHVRFFEQPQGFVSQALDIDLVTGKLILYPGTRDTWAPQEATPSPDDVRRIRDAFASEAFRRTPEQNDKLGADGASYLIEVNLNGSYRWKLHYAPDDETLKSITSLCKGIASRVRATANAR